MPYFVSSSWAFLGPISGNAGNVVGACPHQGLKIDHLVGPDAPDFQQRRGIEDFVLPGVEELHAVA